MKKTVFPILLWLIFETVAVVLWQAKDNLFYLLNFSYIGTSLAIALLLFARRHPHARRVSQLLIGHWHIYAGISGTDLSGKHANRRLLVLFVYRCL